MRRFFVIAMTGAMMVNRKLLSIVMVSFYLAACGSPTAPTPAVVNTPPPVVVAPPVTPPQARLEHRPGLDSMTFLGCLNGLCRYEATAHNGGDGCANTVTGISRIISSQGVEMAASAWALQAITLIRPGDVFSFFGTDMPQIALNHLDGRLRTDFHWANVSCP